MKSFLIMFFALFMLFSCEDTPIVQPEEKVATIQKQSVIFITGIDEHGSTFYKNAKAHFSQDSIQIVYNLTTIEEIIIWLNTHADGKVYDTIHIVTNSNAWHGMKFKMEADERFGSDFSAESMDLPKLDQGITKESNIIFYSHGLGANKNFMKKLKTVFSAEISPNIYISEFFDIFGGKFVSHYLAKPCYVFYPSDHSPSNVALSKEFTHDYPSVGVDWFETLETLEESKPGASYTNQIEIPVDWEIIYEEDEDFPDLRDTEDIMNWILDNEDFSLALFEMGIPMRQFNWTSESNGKTLKINGKSSVLCVLIPIMDSYEPPIYSMPDMTHPRLYKKL